MLGYYVGIRCLRRQTLVATAARASISTTQPAYSIGKSVLYDLPLSNKKTAGMPKEKPDGIRSSSKKTAGTPKEKPDGVRGSKENTHSHRRAAVASKGDTARSAARSAGYVKVDRKEKIQNAQESVQSLTSEMAEARRKSLQTNDTRERLAGRLKDGSLEPWQRRKIELKLKLKGEGWSPTKKLATSSMEKIRLLNAEFPEVWTMQRLSKQFKVSQEAVRRILKSRFQPSETHIQEREAKRKEQIKEYKSGQLKQGKQIK